MSGRGPTTTVKIFADREFDPVEIPNSDLPGIRRFAEQAREQYAPGRTIQDVCLMSIRDLLVLLKSPSTDNDAATVNNVAIPVMLFASMTDANFREDADNFILFEAWPQKFGCVVYTTAMAASFANDIVSARQHLGLTGGQIPTPPPTRRPGETTH